MVFCHNVLADSLVLLRHGQYARTAYSELVTYFQSVDDSGETLLASQIPILTGRDSSGPNAAETDNTTVNKGDLFSVRYISSYEGRTYLPRAIGK